MSKAVELYRVEQATKARKKQMGLCAVCAKISKDHRVKTGDWVPLSPATLSQWLDLNHTRLNQSSECRALLNDAEAEAVVTYCEELAKRGFPKSLGRLKELVNGLIHTRDGPAFPGVGINWASCFVMKHSDHLSSCWSTSLDSKRGQAVNPTTHAMYCKALEDALGNHGTPIEVDCLWAVDESGFAPGEGRTEWVVGMAGKKLQYQQCSGSHETITIIPTICADGSSIAPVVIFKGKAFNVKWHQNNPLGAS